MADLSTPEGKLVERLGPEAGIDAVDLDMIRRGDMLGSQLGAKVYAALSRIAAERDEQLASRDAFIVDKGLWLEFVAQLPTDRSSVVSTLVARASAAERERDELKAEVERLREALTNAGRDSGDIGEKT